jgi:diguanylate cyclase (GGDEF)-like protein
MQKSQKKRILIFLVFPILLVVFFEIDYLLAKILVGLAMLGYAGMLIFLRNPLSGKDDDIAEDALRDNPIDSETGATAQKNSEDPEGSFTIIRAPKDDIITDENFIVTNKYNYTEPIPDDLKVRFEEIANESIPAELDEGGAFTFVLEKILSIIKESFSAHSVIFFWYLKKKNKLSVAKYASNTKDIGTKKYDVENDILSHIVEKGEPEILTNILLAAESDIIRYYTKPQGIKSVVGVPVYHNKQLIGVLLVDSKESDLFGMETIYLLGRFVRLFTILIGLFEEQYSETISQTRLRGLLKFISPLNAISNEGQILEIIENSIESIINWDAFVLVFFQPETQKFVTKKVLNKTSLKFVGENLEIDIKGTLAGKCIMSGTPVKIDDTSTLQTKRFTRKEDVSFEGSFVCVPLIYQKQNFGLLCFESLKKNAYSVDDINYLLSITSMLSFVVYAYSSQVLLKSLAAFDVETRLYNKKMFEGLLAIELEKSNRREIPTVLLLMKMDEVFHQESLFEENPVSKIIKAIGESVKEELPPTALFSRLDEKLLGIHFYDITAQDVYLWAERVRVKIARLNFPTASGQSTFTVSMGIASCTGRNSVDEVFENADLALQKAIQDGGNKVNNIN